MSYEGYEQILCKNGHLSIVDAYSYPSLEYIGEWHCGECGEIAAFNNSIDDTNCDAYGEIEMGQFLIKEATFEECPTCSYKKRISPDIYHIPTEEERKKARGYRPGYGGTPLVQIQE